jgi:hypothetical protein
MKTCYLLPIAAGCIALMSCNNQKDGINDALDRRPNESVRDAAEDVGDTVKDAAKDIGDAVDNATD